MHRLTFFTTNRAKLAHFKYIASLLDIDVVGFRELTFRASYIEPKIRDRSELLKSSYESALDQWIRAGGSENDIFFLEDTSVIVNALSNEEETPGVDVKFWMKGMTFKKLDKLLEENGNDRSVVVRSDIIAHIPKNIVRIHKLPHSFIWATAQQKGSIISASYKVQTNLLFPWLDNKTFNKWFVPDSSDKPISALSIEEANRFDFRMSAFKTVIEKYKSLGLDFPKKNLIGEQLSLPGIDNPRVLVICGYSCAGKSTLAEWLVRNIGYLHLEASDFMYQQYWQRHGVSSNVKIGDFAEVALKHNPAIVAAQVASITSKSQRPVVVTGFRSPFEIESLSQLLPTFEIITIFVESETRTRFRRAVDRNREHTPITRFEERDRQERRMGVDEIKTKCSSRIVQNNSTLDTLFRSFSKKFSKHFDSAKQPHLPPLNLGDLEKAIIMSLGKTDYRCFGRDQSDKWFTTTEIAHLIGRELGLKKSKDNISRYFNQGFYPYYDLRMENKRLFCRLSNTGVSLALLMGNSYSPDHRTLKKISSIARLF